MAHLLQRKDEAPPNEWQAIRGDAARQWRQGVRERMQKAPKGQVTTEFDVARHNAIEEAPTLNRETGIIERPTVERPREARETIEVLTQMMLDNILDESKGEQARLQRIQLLKQTAGWGHLTDAEALDQLSTLAAKLARRDAERRYAEMGLNKPVDLGG